MDTRRHLSEPFPALPQHVDSGRGRSSTGQLQSGYDDVDWFCYTRFRRARGRALFSAQEGDANRTGDQALFGTSSNTASALSGPNNFANNFFASQINKDAGQLNTTGTFGTRNQTNGAPGSNIVGGRQGWDITNVDISARLVNNQSSAVLVLTTSGDAYAVNASAIQININAPKIDMVKSTDVSTVVVGDIITYTVTVNNSGTG